MANDELEERLRIIAEQRWHTERRDRMATAAMKGIISDFRYFETILPGHSRREVYAVVAEEARRYADALIADLDSSSEKSSNGK